MINLEGLFCMTNVKIWYGHSEYPLIDQETKDSFFIFQDIDIDDSDEEGKIQVTAA